MSSTMSIFVAMLMVSSVCATNEVSSGALTGMASLKAMQQVFYRSQKMHSESMASMMRTMTPEKAWQVLEKHNLTTPALIEVTSSLHGKHLRKAAPKGYAGLDGARKLLNDMIFESMSKYDAEIAKCTDYYAQQCAGMEACRGQISASNYIAANSRALILDAQATINKMEVDIPEAKQELKAHNEKCKRELRKMKDRLAIIEGDLEVLTVILQMTDCKKKSFVEMRRCEDPCTKKSFIEFNNKGLMHKVSQLQSSKSHELMQETFNDLFEGVESLESVEFLQIDSTNITKFNNPPVPRTQVPGNPCQDEYAGAPNPKKRGNKCALNPGQCYKLQERFLLIQSGVQDERDALLEDIASMEAHCEETRKTLEAQIASDQKRLDEAQTKLGLATEKEASAGETARQTAAEHDQLEEDLQKQMKSCSANYVNFESEMCALKKIRGELYKMKGDGHSGFFQDCEVSAWDPEECTKKCKRAKETAGEQKLTRSVLTHPNGGTKCLPLAAIKRCNMHPCPVDCHLAAWSGWSKCSAECGGGVQQRLREVKKAMRFGGKPCGATSQTRSCNNQACEADCDLTEWTKWSFCSKDCDGGTRKRQKFVQKQPEGAGKCPSAWSKKRLQFKTCNMFECLSPKHSNCSHWETDKNMYTCDTLPTCCNGHQGLGITSATVQCIPSDWASDPAYTTNCGVQPLKCKEKLDIVFLLDGSGSLGQKGWDAEIKAAELFVDAFSGTGAQAEMAVILYSGPRTWGGVFKCIGKNAKTVDMKEVCKIQTVTRLGTTASKDMKQVKAKIKALEWPKGSTLTSLALMKAKAELSLGRKDAKSVVVVITDGRPLSYLKTTISSRKLRKATRLVWVPVTRYAPLRRIKKWATRRWQENVVVVKEFEDLEKPDPVNHVIANICPDKAPKVQFGRLA